MAGNLDAVQAQLTRFLEPLGYPQARTDLQPGAGEGVPQVIDPRMAGYLTRTIKALTYDSRLTRLVRNLRA